MNVFNFWIDVISTVCLVGQAKLDHDEPQLTAMQEALHSV